MRTSLCLFQTFVKWGNRGRDFRDGVHNPGERGWERYRSAALNCDSRNVLEKVEPVN